MSAVSCRADAQVSARACGRTAGDALCLSAIGGMRAGTNDPRVLVGIGLATEVEKVVIRWPSKIVSTLKNLKVDQEYKVVEPESSTPPSPAEAKEKPKPGK